MTQRKSSRMKARRDQMEKSITGKCRIQFSFIILASFLLLLLLLSFYYSSAFIVGNNKVILVVNNYASSVVSRESNFLHVNENSNRSSSVSILPVTGNPITEVKGNSAESGERIDVIENEDNGTRVADNSSSIIEEEEEKEEEEESINGTGIAENFNKSLSVEDERVEDVGQISVFEKQEEPINGTGIAENSIGSLFVEDGRVEDVVQISVFGKEEKPINGTGIAENFNSSSPVEDERVEDVHQKSVFEKEFEPKNQTLLAVAEKEEQSVNRYPSRENATEVESDIDSCSGRYIYIHDLPSRFNDELLKHCRSLSTWSNMCPFISNMGLGPQLPNSERVFSKTGWFATNQFLLEVIFHNRMKQYKCLTNDSSLASAIFVPFYAGLDVARYLWGFNTSMRDAASIDMVKWLVEKPEWKLMWGRDHFMVAGRISWDFRRLTNEEVDWGNNFLFLPESLNMTMLVIESSPWNNNDFAIPYPTYFHPSSDNEMFQWQNRMRRLKRRYLFSFAGAPRPNLQDSIRGEIINQCQASRRKCKLLECNSNKCHKPVNVMKMFQSSVFCLQPPGDSYTRRSAFDSILAGCIPVFFHPGSAYVQYLWHLPKNYKKYSVFIPSNHVKDRKISIEKTLHRISKQKVANMREEVIRLIPKIVYADPRFRLETLEDAFDIAVKGVLGRVETIRRDMKAGRNNSFDIHEDYSWKYNLFGTVGEHEWDPFFSKTNNVNN